MTEQRHKEAIQRLVEHSGNNECAECFLEKPSYASLSLGIFLCPVCAKVHERCIPKLGDVVSILKHKWTKEEVDFLYTEGNIVANAKYEKHLPIYYHRPRPDDPAIVFEQWVLAKYIRGEFRELSQQSSYNQGTKTGAIFKRLKDQDKFQRRKFILSEPDGTLQYFIKYSDKNPKDNIPIRNLVNVYLVPEKVGNENGMQITYEKDGIRRNLYVFGEDGKNTSDWYHAIRSSMARHKYKGFPDSDVKRYLNTTIVMEGWMSKTGPKKHEKFRRRWFSLIGTAIWYYAQPMDAHHLGFISLGSKTFGYGMMRGFPKGIREEGYGLTIHTPERAFVLNCANMDTRESWASHVEQILVSCTNVWTKPSIGKLGHTGEKVINLDDIDDLTTPSSTSVFTEIPQKAAKNEQRDKVINLDDIDDLDTPVSSSIFAAMPSVPSENKTSSAKSGNGPTSEPRKPLFEKNIKSGQKKGGNIASKISIEKRGKHGGTVKIGNKEKEKSDFRPGSKKYSDDSETEGSESDSDVVPALSDSLSPLHKQAQRLLKTERDRMRISSSATDEDSEEEIVTIRKINNGENVILRVSAAAASANRHSFPRASQSNLRPGHQSPRPQSPLARPRSALADGSVQISSGRSTPRKSPRHIVNQQDSGNTSTSSDLDDAKASDFEVLHRKHFHFSQETLNQTLFSAMPELSKIESDSPEEPEKNFDGGNLLVPGAPSDWRSTTFTSQRRVQGKEKSISNFKMEGSQSLNTPEAMSLERKTLKRVSTNLSRAGSIKGEESSDEAVQEIPPRPVDVTIENNTEGGIWFTLFQCEEKRDENDSYVTPWLGAEIAEMPASVGPIRLPSEFEIAVIDTAPGGYGLLRTTGPYYAEPGDVWEVDMPVDDGSAPDMYYHEGMETEDGSVLVYSNVENSKKFEVAIFKSGRKLFCRKNIKPGESAAFKVKQSLYVMPVSQESYYEMEGEDLLASDIISKSSEIILNFKMPKLKVSARRRGDAIFFSR